MSGSRGVKIKSRSVLKINEAISKLGVLENDEFKKEDIVELEAGIATLNTKFYGAQHDNKDSDTKPKNESRAKELISSNVIQYIMILMDKLSPEARNRVESIILFVIRRGFADEFFERIDGNIVWNFILMNYANSNVGHNLRNIVEGLSKRERMVTVMLKHDRLLDTLFDQTHNPEFDIQIQAFVTLKRVCGSKVAGENLFERWKFLFPRLKRVC